MPPDGMAWAADTGRYASPHEYDDDRYLAWLEKLLPHRDRCLFTTAPDVWGDWESTWEMSEPMVERIREAGYPVAIVAQDGLEPEYLPALDEGVSAMFIGGSDRWRHSGRVRELVAEAKLHGLWVHLGRVNSYKRLDFARALGCDSVDGTVLRFDPTRPVREWMDRAHREPHIWPKP